MPKTRAGRGTALKNSILAQAWFLVENQTPADIEQMMESWRKEAWSFYGNHTSRTNCSTNISHTTLIQDYPEGGQRAPDVENFCKAIHTTKLRRMLEPHTGQHTNYVKYWMNKDYGKLRQGLRLLASNCDFLDLSNNVPLYWRVILKNIGCMRGFSDAKDHGARAKRAREGGTNTLGGEIRQWNSILSIGEILMEPIFYNPRIGGPWNDRIQEKVGWELEDRKKRNECHIIRNSKYRRDLATERLKKNIEIAEVGITHMTHLIKGAEANETLDIHSWESLNEKYNNPINNLPPQIHNPPGKIVAFGAYERHRWEGKNVVFILELARSEEALGKKWETGRRFLKQTLAANTGWADEYHLIAKTTANHATHLYEHTGFERDPIGGSMRDFQPRPEQLEEYWTVEATKFESKLRGEITEEGWSYKEIEKIVTGSDEGKGIKKIYDKTHRSDRGGDGILWSEYNNKLNPHIIIIKKPENNIETEIGRREAQPRKKLPFSRKEYEDLINHIPITWKETIKAISETKKKHPSKTLIELMKSLTPMQGTWVRNSKGKIGLIEDGSPRTLHAFSGKAGRHDGLAQLLLKYNTQCQEIDTVIHASRHDLLCDIIFRRTLKRAQLGYYTVGVMGIPCSTFSVARIGSNGIEAPGPVRDRNNPTGLNHLTPLQQT